MAFWEQVAATLVGSFGGFIGALIVLWIKVSVADAQKEKALLKNLKYEIEYNVNLLSVYLDNVNKCIEAVTADSKKVYLTLDYEFIARHFSINFYREGLVSKYLHVQDLKQWNDFLSTLSPGGEAYVSEMVTKWRDDKATKDETFIALTHERNQIKYAIDMCEYLKTRIGL